METRAVSVCVLFEVARYDRGRMRFPDLSLGLVDATAMTATEMLRETKLATLDHRHFAVVRAAHAQSLTLLA